MLKLEKISSTKYLINDLKATKEEYYIGHYLNELKVKGFVKEIIFQPESFILFEGLSKKFYKNKQLKKEIKRVYSKKQYLINPHVYTADFKVIWEKGFENRLLHIWQQRNPLNTDLFFISNGKNNISYLEVKPSYDQNGKTQMFRSYVQPQIWEKYGIYVQIIKPLELFKNTFIPEFILEDFYYKIGKKKGNKKEKWEYKTLNEFLKLNNYEKT